MIFDGKEFYETSKDLASPIAPKLKAGDEIQLLYDDTSTLLCGSKQLKKGCYTISRVRYNKIFKGHYYDMVKKGAKHPHNICQVSIDKAIDAQMILIKT